MEKSDWLIVALLILLGLIIWSAVIHHTKSDNACKEIGFNEFKEGVIDYCKDLEGNLHYVEMDCPLPFFTECTVKEISVGEVRVE